MSAQYLKLWFLPPHSPDGNLLEQLWAWLKTKLAWKGFDNLDELKQGVADILTQTTTVFLASIPGKSFLSDAL